MYNFNFHNEWLDRYFQHIDTAETVEIGEKHHIFPRCIFGENSITKRISILDHFKAHWLLYKAYKENKSRNPTEYRSICFSLSQFNQVNDARRKRLQKLTEEELLDYGRLCAEARKANSEASKGDLNPQKRPEVREKISKQTKGKGKGIKRSQESINKGRKTAIENGKHKELVVVFHVISGEISKVHEQIVQILHEHWQPGRKFLEKDDTLYWPPDYLNLKDQLRRKEYTTGLQKTKEHVDKINKNPEKIRKTVEKHLGSKRSTETKKTMSEKRKEYLKSIGGAQNKGMKIFYNPNNISEIKQCFPEQCPEGWIRGNPRSTKKEKDVATRIN